MEAAWREELIEARQRARALSASLPASIDVASIGVTSKAPYQLLAAREALIWRTEELSRNACEALDIEDFAVAALLTRAVAESAALAWYLLEILQGGKDRTPDELN